MWTECGKSGSGSTVGQKADGGQGGCANREQNQPLAKSNQPLAAIEFTNEFDGIPNRVRDAAEWLNANRAAVHGSSIALLKTRFGLRNLEAIEAAKHAHALAFASA